MAKTKVNTAPAAEYTEKEYKSQSGGVLAMKRLLSNPVAIVCLTVIILFALVSIFADFVAPYSAAQLTGHRFARPGEYGHLFGTDQLGRDLFSRVLYGARYSMALGLGATCIAVIFGLVLGSLSGYYGGLFDNVMMRFVDIVQSIPGVLMNIALSVVLGSGYINTMIALGISRIPGFIRIQRSAVLTVRQQEYIDAASVSNCSVARKIFKHIVPNSFSPILVSATMQVSGTIMAAAGLSFLGLGVPQEIPEWGALLSAGRNYIKNYPYLTVLPGICLIVYVLCINLFGDALRDALDPKLKK